MAAASHTTVASGRIESVFGMLLAFLAGLKTDYLDMVAEVRDEFEGIVAAEWDSDASAVQKVRMAQNIAVKTIARALVTVALSVVILNQIFTIDAVNNSSGPFTGLISTVENIGGAAITLTVVGLLVLGGAVAMSFMDRF